MNEFADRIKISEKMYRIIDSVLSKEYNIFWEEGSAQTGKSVTAAIAFALIIENAPAENDLFITLGYTESSAINNCWKCSGFGLEHYFGPNCTRGLYPGTNIKCLKIKTKTGMKYVLAFGSNTKTSGNAFHGFKVSGFLFDEIDRACEEVVIEMMQRVTAVQDYIIIITQNPNVPTHWCYTNYLNPWLAKDKVMWTHWVLDDNIGLTADKIQAVKDMYDPTSIYYRRYILGERVNPEGCVYTIRDYNIIDSFNQEDYLEYVTVADPGVNSSASGFVLCALKFDHQTHKYCMDILKEYRHKNAEEKNAGIKMPKDYAEDYCQFVKESMILMGGRYPTKMIIDEDVTFWRELRSACIKYGLNWGLVKYCEKDEVEDRIKNSINALFSARLRFYKDCQHTIDCFKNALYDDKKALQGKYVYLDHPEQGTEIDLVDATCYGMNNYINKLYIN